MNPQVSIAYAGTERSDTLDSQVHVQVAKLARLYPSLERCRVAVQLPRHRGLGPHHAFVIHMGLRVAGADLEITHQHIRPDAFASVSAAFEAARKLIQHRLGIIRSHAFRVAPALRRQAARMGT